MMRTQKRTTSVTECSTTIGTSAGARPQDGKKSGHHVLLLVAFGRRRKQKDPPATYAVKVSLIKSKLDGNARLKAMLLTLPGSQEPSYSPLRGKKHTADKRRCQRLPPREAFTLSKEFAFNYMNLKYFFESHQKANVSAPPPSAMRNIQGIGLARQTRLAQPSLL